MNNYIYYIHLYLTNNYNKPVKENYFNLNHTRMNITKLYLNVKTYK